MFLFWAAAPKGAKSWKTPGDFGLPIRLSLHLFLHPQPLKPGPDLSGLKYGLSGLKFGHSGPKSGLRPEFLPIRPGIWPFKPKIWPLGLKICPLKSEICLLKPEICLLRPGNSPLRPLIKVPLRSTRLGLLWGRRAALLPLTQIHNHAKQGNGNRWPHIALGRLDFV